MQKKTNDWEFNKVLHKNRWFIWAIIWIVFVCVMLLGIISVATEQISLTSVFEPFAAKHIFTDSQQGYRVRYPASWQLEKDSQGNVVFENPQSKTESITVTETVPGNEAIVRRAFRVVSERDSVRNGVSVAIMSVTDIKSGAPFKAAIVKTPVRMFYISGDSAMFATFVDNFSPLSNN